MTFIHKFTQLPILEIILMKKLKYKDELVFFLVILSGFAILILVKIFIVK